MAEKGSPQKDSKIFQRIIKTVGKKGVRIAFYTLAWAMILASVFIFLFQWNDGIQAEKQAEALLLVVQNSSSTQSPVPSATPASPSPSETTAQSTAPALPSPTEPILVSIDDLEGYSVIAILDIAKLDLQLPVLSKTSEEALKVSVCYFEGSAPGSIGNLVITGHNYTSGAHFGRLDELEIGDSITLTRKDDISDNYTVYEIEHINPDDIAALSETQYAMELTLLTCEQRGNRRLLVRCMIDNEFRKN